MKPTILPTGTQCRWQYAIRQADPAVWDELASTLLRDARDEPDHRIRDDILLLCLVACERAADTDPAQAYSLMQMDLLDRVAA